MQNKRRILSLMYKGYAGVAFVSTLIVFYPPIFLLLQNKRLKKTTMPLFSWWSTIFHALILVPYKKAQFSKLPDEPFILCANHASYMDITIMPSLLRGTNFLFMGKAEILSYPFIKTFFKKLHIPVNRSDKRQSARSFIQANRALKDKWSIVLFPEGGIPDGQRPKMEPFKPGAFKLALSSNAPIVPVTFVNNYRLFSDPDDIWGRARPGISKIIIHEPIYPNQYAALSAEELSQLVYAIIEQPLLAEISANSSLD